MCSVTKVIKISFRVGHCHRQLIGINMYIINIYRSGTKFRKLSTDRYEMHMLHQSKYITRKTVKLKTQPMIVFTFFLFFVFAILTVLNSTQPSQNVFLEQAI